MWVVCFHVHKLIIVCVGCLQLHATRFGWFSYASIACSCTRTRCFKSGGELELSSAVILRNDRNGRYTLADHMTLPAVNNALESLGIKGKFGCEFSIHRRPKVLSHEPTNDVPLHSVHAAVSFVCKSSAFRFPCWCFFLQRHPALFLSCTGSPFFFDIHLSVKLLCHLISNLNMDPAEQSTSQCSVYQN
jgi:hypothetical protein